jgi:hypothetical protein
MAWIHHMQGGGYIPGFSSVVKGARLDQDVRDWREGFGEHIGKVEDFAKKSKMLSWLGGKAAKIGAHVLGFGAAGDAAEKGGEWLGASDTARKLFGIKPPDDYENKTGLGQKQVQAVEDYESGVGKGLQGEALGGAGSLLKSMALSKIPALGSAETFGSELRSGIGKSLMDKYGFNIGKSFEPEQLTQSAQSMWQNPFSFQSGGGVTDAEWDLWDAGLNQSFMGGRGNFEVGDVGHAGPPIYNPQEDEQAVAAGQAQMRGEYAPGPKYESLMAAFAEADKNKGDIMAAAKERNLRPENLFSRMMKEHVGEGEDQRSIAEAYGSKSLFDKPQGYTGAIESPPLELKRDRTVHFGAPQYVDQPEHPGRMTEALQKYSARGQNPAIYKAMEELGGFGHAEQARGREETYQKSLADMDRGIIGSIRDLFGQAKSSYEGMNEPSSREDILSNLMSRYSRESIDKKRDAMAGLQMGGAVSNPIPYNLGGSVYQQPMQYQLGGLLKYRSPM